MSPSATDRMLYIPLTISRILYCISSILINYCESYTHFAYRIRKISYRLSEPYELLIGRPIINNEITLEMFWLTGKTCLPLTIGAPFCLLAISHSISAGFFENHAAVGSAKIHRPSTSDVLIPKGNWFSARTRYYSMVWKKYFLGFVIFAQVFVIANIFESQFSWILHQFLTF